MSDKTLDQKTKSDNSVGSAAADLKFDYDATNDRTWVNKDKFPEFLERHEEIQENSSLSDGSSVQFNIKVKLKHLETKKE